VSNAVVFFSTDLITVRFLSRKYRNITIEETLYQLQIEGSLYAKGASDLLEGLETVFRGLCFTTK